MNAYIDIEQFTMEDWEEIVRQHPVSREMEAFLEGIIGEVDIQPIEHDFRPKNNNGNFTCTRCNKRSTRRYDLKRHLKIHAQKKEFNCDTCTRTFYRKDKLQQHEIVCRRKTSLDLNKTQLIAYEGNNFTARKRLVCTHCKKDFKRNFDLQRHVKIHARRKEFHCSTCTKTFYPKDKKLVHESECTRQEAVRKQVESSKDITSENQTGGGSTTTENNEEDCQSAFDGNLKIMQMKPRQNEKFDLTLFLQEKKANVLKHLEKELNEEKGIKWFISVQVKMVKYNIDLEDTFAEPHLRSNCQRLLHLQDLPEQYLNCVDKIKESFETYQREGSGCATQAGFKIRTWYCCLCAAARIKLSKASKITGGQKGCIEHTK